MYCNAQLGVELGQHSHLNNSLMPARRQPVEHGPMRSGQPERDLADLTTEELAAEVEALGSAFAAYSTEIRANAVDGADWVEYSNAGKLHELFDELHITSALHRRKLQKFGASSSAPSGGGPLLDEKPPALQSWSSCCWRATRAIVLGFACAFAVTRLRAAVALSEPSAPISKSARSAPGRATPAAPTASAPVPAAKSPAVGAATSETKSPLTSLLTLLPSMPTDSPATMHADEGPVPDTLHKVWVDVGVTHGQDSGCLPFREFLSLLNSVGMLRPRRILLHSTAPALPLLCTHVLPGASTRKKATPNDEHQQLWGDCTSKLGVQVVPANVAALNVPNMSRFARREHLSDLIRLYALNRHGGIYVDADIYLLNTSNDLAPLRQRAEMTLWRDNNHRYLNNGLIVARPNSSFGRAWWDFLLHDWDGRGWNHHSCDWPARHARQLRAAAGRRDVSEAISIGFALATMPCGKVDDDLNTWLTRYSRHKLGVHASGIDRIVDAPCRNRQRLPLFRALLRRFESTSVATREGSSCVTLARRMLYTAEKETVRRFEIKTLLTQGGLDKERENTLRNELKALETELGFR